MKKPAKVSDAWLLLLKATFLVCLIVPIFTPQTAVALPNLQINYQGKLTDDTNAVVTDGSYSIVFSLYTVASGGSAIWTETQSVTVTNGLFSVLLGSSSSLSDVDFNQGALYLGVKVGSDSEMSPRKQLGSVPSSFTSTKFDGLATTSFIRSDATNSTSTSSTYLTIQQTGSGNVANFVGSSGNALTIASNGTVTVGGALNASSTALIDNYLIVGSTTAPDITLDSGDIWANGSLWFASTTSIFLSEDDLVFEDAVAGSKTLSELAGQTCSRTNGLISGGLVSNISGYNFAVSAATYCINGVFYSSNSQTVTLDAADATYDRIDVIYLDNTGTAGTSTGATSTNPVPPSVDPETKLDLTFVLVAAGSTGPTFDTEVIYNENTEWTSSQSTPIGQVDFDNTTDPYVGSKHTEVTTALRTNDYFQFSDTDAYWDPSGYKQLVFRIKNKAAWTNSSNVRLDITFRNNAGSQIGSVVRLYGNRVPAINYNFDPTNTSSYQLVAVPLTAFGTLPYNQIKTLRFNAVAGSAATALNFRIDRVVLEGEPEGSGSSNWLTGEGEAGQLAFWSSANQLAGDAALVWNSVLGRLGIGTTSPYAALSVVGQIVGNYFTATSTSQASTFPYASTTALSVSSLTQGSLLFAGAAGGLSQNNDKLFWDNTNEILYVNITAGNRPCCTSGVVIGDMSDSSILYGMDVYGYDSAIVATAANDAAIVANGVTGVRTTGESIGIYVEGGTSSSIRSNQANSGSYNIYASGGINYFTGSVGIGATSPTAKLFVTGQTVAEYFTATSTSQASTFPYASTTALTVSEIASTSALIVSNDASVGGDASISGEANITGTTTVQSNIYGRSNAYIRDNDYAYSLDSETPPKAGARNIDVSGDYLYAASQQNDAIQVFDVSDPTDITFLASSTTNLDDVYDVTVSGSTLYAASFGNSRLVSFDVSDPSDPTYLDHETTGVNGPNEVAVSGNYAYLVNGTASVGFSVFDVSNPSSISNVFSTSTVGGLCRGIAISGNYAFVTCEGVSYQDGGGAGSDTDGQFRIYDISTPTAPTYVYATTSDVRIGDARDVFVSGNYAYITSLTDYFTVWNISTPSSPSLVGQIGAITGANWVVVSGDYAYISDALDDFKIIDVSTPASPSVVQEIDPASGFPYGVDIYENTLYLSYGAQAGSGNSIYSYDISYYNALSNYSQTAIDSRLLVWGNSNSTSLFNVLNNDSNYFTITPTGKVGISSTSPESLLTVSGTSTLRDLIPETSLTYNLGTSARRWNEAWISTLNIGTSTWSLAQSANGRFSIFDSASGGGNERFSILSSGNVGIGTTSPYARLSVVGQAVAEYFTATSTIQASTFPYASTTALTVSGTASTSNTIVSNNLTIGSLNGPLQAVNGLVSVTSTLSTVYGGTGASSFGQGWIYSNGGTGALAASTSPTVNYVTATSTSQASTFPYASTTALTVSGNAYFPGSGIWNSSGRVGIGTTSPAGLLEVGNSTAGAVSSYITNANTGTGSYAELLIRNTYVTASGLRLLTMGTGYTTAGAFTQDSGVIEAETDLSGGLSIMTRASAPIRFYTNGHTNERMRIDENGNLGVGSSTISSKLSVLGADGSGGSNAQSFLGLYGGAGYFDGGGSAATDGGSGIIVSGNGGGGQAGDPGSVVGGNGGAFTIRTGAGGSVEDTCVGCFSLVGGNGGLLTIAAGAGGDVGSGQNDTPGTGGAISITSGAGGNDNSNNFTGGNGGNITIQTGAGGTGGQTGSYGYLLLNSSGGAVGIQSDSSPAAAALTIGQDETSVVTGKLAVFNTTSSFITSRNTGNDIEMLFGPDTLTGVLGMMTDHALLFRAGNGAGAGNTTYMTLARGGNFGIGETAPGSKLSVSGGGSFGSGYDTTAAPTNGLIVQGRVGIGTTTPGKTLEIYQESITSGLRLRGIDPANEIADIWSSGNGALSFSVASSSASEDNRYFDFYPGDDVFGLILRSSDVTTTYGNVYVDETTTDYLNITVNVGNGTAGLVVTEDENVGIGTKTPADKLDVVGGISATLPQDNYSYAVAVSWIYDGGQARKLVAASGADIAEPICSTFPIDDGVVVVADPDSDEKVIESPTSYDNRVLGVVVKDPGFLISVPDCKPEEYGNFLVLAGRVPIKVSGENGPIYRGDPIATSDTAGHGMLATDYNSGIYAIALENFEPETASSTGMILAMIRPSTLPKSSQLSPMISGGGINSSSTPWIINGSGEITLYTSMLLNGFDLKDVRSITSASGNWSIDENGVLTVKEVRTDKLCVGSVCIDEVDLQELLDNGGISGETISNEGDSGGEDGGGSADAGDDSGTTDESGSTENTEETPEEGTDEPAPEEVSEPDPGQQEDPPAVEEAPPDGEVGDGGGEESPPPEV